MSPVDTVSIGVQCEIAPLVVTKEKLVEEIKIVRVPEVTIKEVVKTIETPVINERTTTLTQIKEVPVTKTVIQTVDKVSETVKYVEKDTEKVIKVPQNIEVAVVNTEIKEVTKNIEVPVVTTKVEQVEK